MTRRLGELIQSTKVIRRQNGYLRRAEAILSLLITYNLLSNEGQLLILIFTSVDELQGLRRDQFSCQDRREIN